MNYDFYIDRFKISVAGIDKKILKKNDLEISVGVILNSVYLKLYKKSWMNENEDQGNAKTKIFFSIWLNDKTLKGNKLFYNIHALKLRQLAGYSISSKSFANTFRKYFKAYQSSWENVHVNFGPLTLMEGWVEFDIKNLENRIISLVNNFITINHLVDKTLKEFERTGNSQLTNH